MKNGRISYDKIKDEIIESKGDRPYECEAVILVYLLECLLKEKEQLIRSIAKAEKKAGMDIKMMYSAIDERETIKDSMIQMSKNKDMLVEIEQKEFSFLLNENGSTIRFPVKETIIMDYDREEVARIADRISEEIDKLNNEMNHILLETKIDFEPSFNITNKIQDIIDTFCWRE